MGSRFGDNTNLVSLQTKLNELNAKCGSLKSAQKGLLSYFKSQELVNAKYVILTSLQVEMRRLINHFNNQPKQDDVGRESQEIMVLIAQLKMILLKCVELHGDTLNQATDMGKNFTKNTVYFGSRAAAVTTVYATAGVAVLPILAAYYISTGLSSKVLHESKLDSEWSDTMRLLLELNARLESTYNVFSTMRSALNLSASVSFPPIDGVGINSYTPSTEDYIENTNKKNISEKIAALNLTEEEQKLLAEFQDPITFGYMNIPVRMNGRVYDLETLLKLSSDEEGKRKDPFDNYSFHLCHIQNALDIVNKMEEVIARIKAMRAVQNVEEPKTTSVTRSPSLTQNSLFYDGERGANDTAINELDDSANDTTTEVNSLVLYGAGGSPNF